MSKSETVNSQSQIADGKGPFIHFPTPEEDAAALQEFLAEQKLIRNERREAVANAIPAMERLAEVLKERSGQPYKIRALLHSMWNGKPAPLIELVCLDWALRKDLVAVMLAFGDDNFFYKEIEAAVRKAGQWRWFLEEINNIVGRIGALSALG